MAASGRVLLAIMFFDCASVRRTAHSVSTRKENSLCVESFQEQNGRKPISLVTVRFLANATICRASLPQLSSSNKKVS
jgi:hypothetical protein